MFDTCRDWQQKLDESEHCVLPIEVWGALEDHCAHCEECSARLRADSQFKLQVGKAVGELSPAESNLFDAGVLSQISLPDTESDEFIASGFNFRTWLKDQIQRSSFAFLGQLAGGVVVASCLTAFCLSAAIQPAYKAHETTHMLQDSKPQAANLANHPVPMESLLVTPSPKAALLWSKTPPAASVSPDPSSAQGSTLPLKNPHDQHGFLPTNDHIG